MRLAGGALQHVLFDGSATAVRLTDGHLILAYCGDIEWTKVLLRVAKGGDPFSVDVIIFDRRGVAHMNCADGQRWLPQ